MFELRERIEQRVTRHRRQNHVARIAESLGQDAISFARTRGQDNLSRSEVAAAFCVLLGNRLPRCFPTRCIGVPTTERGAALVHGNIQINR